MKKRGKNKSKSETVFNMIILAMMINARYLPKICSNLANGSKIFNTFALP